MKVSEIMSAAKACCPTDDLQRAAQIMWENDCGVVPVVDGETRVVGMITDRDICMASYTHGQPLWSIPVSSAMATVVYAVHVGDPLETAETLMRRVRVRRLPVLDAEGRLIGILSLNDLARHAHRSPAHKSNSLSGDRIVQTLAAVGEPQHAAADAKGAAANGSRTHLPV
ncbi:MAG: CBS domain-containing protein [Polyangiaceae bacterium]